eukprot:scaffold1875_cov253-Pinguiococcus_pyrenoidosus.AAC.14
MLDAWSHAGRLHPPDHLPRSRGIRRLRIGVLLQHAAVRLRRRLHACPGHVCQKPLHILLGKVLESRQGLEHVVVNLRPRWRGLSEAPEQIRRKRGPIGRSVQRDPCEIHLVQYRLHPFREAPIHVRPDEEVEPPPVRSTVHQRHAPGESLHAGDVQEPLRQQLVHLGHVPGTRLQRLEHDLVVAGIRPHVPRQQASEELFRGVPSPLLRQCEGAHLQPEIVACIRHPRGLHLVEQLGHLVVHAVLVQIEDPALCGSPAARLWPLSPKLAQQVADNCAIHARVRRPCLDGAELGAELLKSEAIWPETFGPELRSETAAERRREAARKRSLGRVLAKREAAASVRNACDASRPTSCPRWGALALKAASSQSAIRGGF